MSSKVLKYLVIEILIIAYHIHIISTDQLKPVEVREKNDRN